MATAATHRAARAVRGSPAVSLAAVAAAAGIAERVLGAELRQLPKRGRCDTIVADLVHDGCAERDQVLNDSRCPPTAKRLAARDGDATTRDIARGVAGWSGRVLNAGKRAVPRAIVAPAAANPNRRFHAAGNESCPPAVLAALCGEEPIEMHIQLANNRSCPPQALAALCGDVYHVRVEVVQHHRCDAAMLAALVRASDDYEEWMAETIANHDRCNSGTVQTMTRHYACHRARGAGHRLCDSATLAVLAADSSERVREAVAENPNCDGRTVAKLAGDAEPMVRIAAALNVRCDPATLTALVSDTEAVVASVALDHPRCGSVQLMAAARGGALSWVRAHAARHPACDAEVLRVFAGDPDSVVRWEAARHSKCPPDQLLVLLTDDNAEVRAEAEQACDTRGIDHRAGR